MDESKLITGGRVLLDPHPFTGQTRKAKEVTNGSFLSLFQYCGNISPPGLDFNFIFY